LGSRLVVAAATSGHAAGARLIVSHRLRFPVLLRILIPITMWDVNMGLLVAYVACLIVGQAITIGIGLSIDWFYSPTVSLPISLVLYFLMFAVAWKVAVRITEPKVGPKAERITPP
jgi:hypothetical protein